MYDISRGIATVALSLQSVLLQVSIPRGVLTPAEALDVGDKVLAAARIDPRSYDEAQVAEVTVACLERIREGLAGMASPN